MELDPPSSSFGWTGVFDQMRDESGHDGVMRVKSGKEYNRLKSK